MQANLSLVPSDVDRQGEVPAAGSGIVTLTQRLAEMSRQLALTRSVLADKQRECQELACALANDAHSDALTGVFNRRKFNELCAAEIVRSGRYGTPLALIMIDIDHFKRVNDVHGHLVGDQVLVDVARLLGERMRATDALCRWGGEEFMILAPHLDAAGAVQMAEKLRAAVAEADFGVAGTMTCSFGVATLQECERAIDLILRADTYLYRAKRSGRNCVAAHSEGAAPTSPQSSCA